MIGLLQRVSAAAVVVDGGTLGAIERGLLVLVGVERADGELQADRLLERLLGYRVFAAAEGKMNLSLRDVDGGLLLVPQFTLAADTGKGMRPSFTPAAPPADGERLFDYLLARALLAHPRVASGRFGADMQVQLINDGPVTFYLRVPPVGVEGCCPGIQTGLFTKARGCLTCAPRAGAADFCGSGSPWPFMPSVTCKAVSTSCWRYCAPSNSRRRATGCGSPAIS